MRAFVKEIVKHAIGCCAEAFAATAGGHLAERIFAVKEEDEPEKEEKDE